MQGREAQPNQTGCQEWKATFCEEHLSSPWLYLELWRLASGTVLIRNRFHNPENI